MHYHYFANMQKRSEREWIKMLQAVMVFLFTSAACQHKFPNVYEIFNPFKPDNQIYSIITLCVNWVNGLF